MRAVMLSGDSPHTAEAIAAELGLEEYEGENSLPSKAERGAIEAYNKVIRLAVEVSDNGTRELLESILVDEEDHIDEERVHLTLSLEEVANLPTVPLRCWHDDLGKG